VPVSVRWFRRQRQTFRLLSRYDAGCAGALIHQARGRASNRQLSFGIREYAVERVRTKYADFGPTLATEILQEKHSITIGRETLRRWMMADGLWLSRKQRKTFHQPRLRREPFGDLIQIDGSDHRWFEDRGDPCTLLVFIDDATSRLMQLRFVLSESTDSYLRHHSSPSQHAELDEETRPPASSSCCSAQSDRFGQTPS
jgi:hypothetical protein